MKSQMNKKVEEEPCFTQAPKGQTSTLANLSGK
jgi:hypothetical protein